MEAVKINSKSTASLAGQIAKAISGLLSEQKLDDAIPESLTQLKQSPCVYYLELQINDCDLFEEGSLHYSLSEEALTLTDVELFEKSIFFEDDGSALLTLHMEKGILGNADIDNLFIAFFTALKSRIQREVDKKKEQERFRFYEKILNSIPSDVVVFDPQHRYKFINPIAISNKEVRDWLVGKDDFDYVEYRNRPKEIAEKRREIFNRVVESKQKHKFEEELFAPDGSREWKLRHMFPVLNELNEEVEMVIGYGLDITEIKQKNRETIEANARLNTLISSLNSGILLEDQDRRILVTNQGFCDIFEIPAPPEVLVGIDCSDSADQAKHLIKQPEKFVRDIDALLIERKPRLSEEIEFADGRIFERDFIPIFYENVYLGHLWEYRDVTQKKKHEQEMMRALEAERSYNELNKNFVSMVSHEFRTPLTAIHSTSELLLGFMERFSDDEKMQRVQRIHNSSLKMEQLINDVLMIGKLDSTNSVLQLSEFNFKEALMEIITPLTSTVLADKRVHFSTYGKDIPIKSDRNLVDLILRNLLENAGKYSARGSKVDVSCKITNELVTICVTDEGIGIPEEEQSLVFESFKRASNTVEIPGTGLGLPIVKKSILRLGGKVHLISEVGKGTSITVTFKNMAEPVKSE